MKLFLLIVSFGVGAAQVYGGSQGPIQEYPSGPSYPVNPGYPPYPEFDSSSSSSSSSEEHNKCHYCKDLKHYDKKISTFKKAEIFYVHEKHGCKMAIVSCPFDMKTYALFGVNSEDSNSAIGNGTYVQRAVKCNKHGRWQADSFEEDKYNFKSVVCQLQIPPSNP